ncbi:hypothetical protein [Motilimonas sp. KMU-193]|uniref:hypothetical protein n=1 Tax=Motilimonas sp. KMU-193 TaxID=3388668 RepID=UPI00396B31C5
MGQAIAISKLELLASPYPDGEVAKHLQYLLEHSHRPVVDSLLNALQPIKLIQCKNKLYPVQSLDELHWLRSLNPNLNVEIYVVNKVRSIEEIEHAIFEHYYFKHSSSINNLDLPALESIWNQQSSRPCYLNQKHYAQLYGCDRSTLNRHQKRLVDATSTHLEPPSEIANDFDWADVTGHIPERITS